MTYNVQRCRGADGRVDPDRILRVISEGAPDIVALQEVDDPTHLIYLAERMAMKPYGEPRSGANAFLSYYQLRGIQEFDLGAGGVCLRADLDIRSRRVHLLNLRLAPSLPFRRRQVSALLGPEILGNPTLACPLLLLGDFGDVFWGPGNMSLTLGLRKARRPLWCSTYPARFPVAGRDRAYLRGEIRVVESSIVRSSIARQASSHLPLVLTVQVTDPRKFLKVEEMRPANMEIAPG